MQQLAVHCRFARVSQLETEPRTAPRHAWGAIRTRLAGLQLLGELALHGSLARVLRESPEWLAGILEAWLSALTTNHPATRTEQDLDAEAELHAMSHAERRVI